MVETSWSNNEATIINNLMHTVTPHVWT